MNCPDCGKELIKIADITDEEAQNVVYINTKLENSITAFNTDNIDPSLFDKGQVYEYYRALADQMAESRFLNKMLRYELSKKYNVPESKMSVIDSVIYKHP